MKKRVGVFVCDCRANIAPVVDTEKVAEFASRMAVYKVLHNVPM